MASTFGALEIQAAIIDPVGSVPSTSARRAVGKPGGRARLLLDLSRRFKSESVSGGLPRMPHLSPHTMTQAEQRRLSC